MMAAAAQSATWAGRFTASKAINSLPQQKTRSSTTVSCLPSCSSSTVGRRVGARTHTCEGGGAGGVTLLRRPSVKAMAAPADGEFYDDSDPTASSGDESFGALAPSQGHNSAGAPVGGVFRSKTGGIGNVLDSGGDAAAGTDYSATVQTPFTNGSPIEGQVVDNASSSQAAGLVDTGEGELYEGGDAMDILFNEIANKNNIQTESVPGQFSDGGGFGAPGAPPLVSGQFVDAPSAPGVEGQAVQDASGASAAGSAVPGSAAYPQVMPDVVGAPPPVQSAVAVTQIVNPMDRLYDDLMLESSMLDDGDLVETVQIVSVRFRVKKQVNFGEVLRMVGGHESMGAWSLRKSPALRWSEGDNWVSDDIELPVDGVYVYKYVVTDAGDSSKPVSWQKGNNQVLTLRAEDAPLLVVQDSWSGDPSKAYTSRADGSDKMQAEVRLVQRIGDADAALHESRMEIIDLRAEVKTAQLQSAALREEARLSSNVRLKLKQQLQAEKKRSEVLEEQVTEWKNKFKALGPSKAPPTKEE